MNLAMQTLPQATLVSEFAVNRLRLIIGRVDLPSGLKAQIVIKRDDIAAVVFVRVGDPNGVCNVTGKPLPWWGRKWMVSPHMTDGEIVQTLFKACETAMEHELREGFKYKGQPIFDPHYDIEKLVELRARPDALQERSND